MDEDLLKVEYLKLQQWKQYFITMLVQSMLADLSIIAVSVIGLWYYLHEPLVNSYQIFGAGCFVCSIIDTVISFHLSCACSNFKILELCYPQSKDYDSEKQANVEDCLKVANCASVICFLIGSFLLVVFR